MPISSPARAEPARRHAAIHERASERTYMEPELGVWRGAPSAIRTRDLLLRRHSPDIADWGWMWPDVAFSCTGSGWVWPGVAPYLPPLAPHLAPRGSR